MAKAKDAFRTISEVAEWLDTPTHVLRFWESKFSQIKPVKGAGGRRYYRPSDMDLLSGIKQLLHEDGLTIKGAQKLLRDKGVKYVSSLGPSIDAALTEPEEAPAPPVPVATAAPAPATAPAAKPVQEMFPFDPPIAPAPKHPHALPRLIGRMPLDASVLHARAAQIAPLVARLENLRERMRG